MRADDTLDSRLHALWPGLWILCRCRGARWSQVWALWLCGVSGAALVALDMAMWPQAGGFAFALSLVGEHATWDCDWRSDENEIQELGVCFFRDNGDRPIQRRTL